MKKNLIIVELKTTMEADKAVLEVDDAVREIFAALDFGNVRPSTSGLVSDMCGLVRDTSGLVRDACRLMRDASGLVSDSATEEK